MTSTQMVSLTTHGRACIPKSSPPATFLLPFGKNVYHVPASAIKSYPKSANEEIKTAEDLSALLHTKAPEKWMPYCQPDYLCRIEGETGNCVYTTFEVPGWPDERRFLRLISATVAAKNFEQIKDEALEKAKTVPITKKHQQIRLEVLDWRKETDCPNRAQINPEIEKWEVVTGAELAKSCYKAPEAKKRVKPGSSQEEEAEAKRKQYICHEEMIKQPPGTTYRINEVGGLLHIVFYRTAATAVAEDDEDDQ
jgi:hypothetical protein